MTQETSRLKQNLTGFEKKTGIKDMQEVEGRRFQCQLALAALVWLSRTIPSAIDTVETLEGFLRTVGVGRVAHPGELAVPDPVGGRVGMPLLLGEGRPVETIQKQNSNQNRAKAKQKKAKTQKISSQSSNSPKYKNVCEFSSEILRSYQITFDHPDDSEEQEIIFLLSILENL